MNSLFTNRRLLIVIALVLLFILFIALLLSGSSDPTPNSSIQSLDNQPVFTDFSNIPHTAENFTVQYLTASDTFIITVTTPPYDKSLQQAYDWLATQNITPSTHRITEGFSRLKPTP